MKKEKNLVKKKLIWMVIMVIKLQKERKLKQRKARREKRSHHLQGILDVQKCDSLSVARCSSRRLVRAV